MENRGVSIGVVARRMRTVAVETTEEDLVGHLRLEGEEKKGQPVRCLGQSGLLPYFGL